MRQALYPPKRPAFISTLYQINTRSENTTL
jgi:hypothetical protein